jgi:hypothetical protein
MNQRPRYKYLVRWSGRFPMDMLRHDEAHPMEDAEIIAQSLNPETRVRGVHEVWLIGNITPTVGRWASFGNCGVDTSTIERI